MTEKTTKIQAQITEVTALMHSNIDQVIERGENLNQLETKATELDTHAFKFKTRATNLTWRMRCENYKWTALIILVGCVMLLILLAVAGVFS